MGLHRQYRTCDTGLAWGIGLRMGETSFIRLSDIGKGELTIRGNGSCEGKMVRRRMSNAVMGAIDRYLVERERIPLESEMECDALLIWRGRSLHGYG